jgi:hypothetical protein
VRKATRHRERKTATAVATAAAAVQAGAVEGSSAEPADATLTSSMLPNSCPRFSVTKYNRLRVSDAREHQHRRPHPRVHASSSNNVQQTPQRQEQRWQQHAAAAEDADRSSSRSSDGGCSSPGWADPPRTVARRRPRTQKQAAHRGPRRGERAGLGWGWGGAGVELGWGWEAHAPEVGALGHAQPALLAAEQPLVLPAAGHQQRGARLPGPHVHRRQGKPRARGGAASSPQVQGEGAARGHAPGLDLGRHSRDAVRGQGARPDTGVTAFTLDQGGGGVGGEAGTWVRGGGGNQGAASPCACKGKEVGELNGIAG